MRKDRLRNRRWEVPVGEDGNAPFDSVKVAVLQDIRDELQRTCAPLNLLTETMQRIDQRLAKKYKLT